MADEEFTREEIEAMERALERDAEWCREVDEEEKNRTLDELENGSEPEPQIVDTPASREEEELERAFFARGDRMDAAARRRQERLPD